MTYRTSFALALSLLTAALIFCGPLRATPNPQEESPGRYPWDVPTQAPAPVNELMLEHAATFVRIMPPFDELVFEILDDGVLYHDRFTPCSWRGKLRGRNTSDWTVSVTMLRVTLRDTEGKEIQVEAEPSIDGYQYRPGDENEHSIYLEYDDANCWNKATNEAAVRLVAAEATEFKRYLHWMTQMMDYQRDVWVLSNPTDRPLAYDLTITRRDSAGMFLRSGEGGCTNTGSSWSGVQGELIWLPPGESVVKSYSLSQDEYEAGVTQELSVTTYAKCSGASFFADYDPDVVLESFTISGDTVTFVINNRSSREAKAGVLYVSVFAADGTPLYGRGLWPKLWRDIPPGERAQHTAELPHSDIGPPASRYEFLWVGMTR